MDNSFYEIRPNRKASGDQWFDSTQNLPANIDRAGHKLDSEESRKTHKKLLEWYYLERERQALNRLDMAMDADFYDGIQWDPDDAATLSDRGQLPLVYNEVAPMIDWILGTERRARVDWKILPRAEDDVKAADIKTKVMKYVSDMNHVPFARSQAFGQAIKSGLGWLDDGVRDDPTKDILYSKSEDWRNVLHDSTGYELDMDDARFVFRWRWVDEDVALMMFPDRQDQIRKAIRDFTQADDSMADGEMEFNGTGEQNSGHIYAQGSGQAVDAKRRRVKLIEAQFKIPSRVKIINSGPLRGAMLHPSDHVLADALGKQGGTLIDKVMMRVHIAVMTEGDLLALSPSIMRHNRFTLTPVWCYRRGRDRQPYGVVRRVRDIQRDLNKRASKALFLMNTNQIIADEGAVEDWETLRDEADRPDGLIVKKQGKDLVIRRDTDAATGQMQMMTLDAQAIQKSSGVNNENLGRQTNAVSGEAIKARQMQGSVGTTEPFDNLRFAVQIQGEKQLSLVEQFYTEEKVIRLTGAKGALDWVSVNKPEQQADGSIRYTNDITDSMADFIVSEQDYAGNLRAVMFDSLNMMASRLPPEISIRLMTIAMEFSDLPNKDEIADQFRKITGERDPNKEMTPEEQQQTQEQMQQQAESMQMQQEMARTALAEAQARVRELNAKAAKMEAEAQATGQEGVPPEIGRQITQVQEAAATQVDKLSRELAKAQAELANRTLSVSKEADVKLQLGRIEADSRERVAEINATSDKKIQALEKRMEDLSKKMAASAKPAPTKD